MTDLDRRSVVLGGLAAVAGAGGAEAAAAPRPYLMGTSRWPPDLTVAAMGKVALFLQDHCDMVSPMVLGGVPWVAADAGAAYSPALLDELDWKAPAGHRVCLSLGPLDGLRQGLAPLFAETDNQPLPDAWAALAFDDPRVIRAYAAFCVEAAGRMRPDWLVIGVELNLLLHNRPDAWLALKTLHRAAYRAVKAAYPDMQVGFSMTLLHLLGLADGADARLQRTEMLDLMTDSDFAGFSVYPHTSWDVPQPVQMGWYDTIAAFGAAAGKPVAVTESGMTSQTVWIGLIRLGGSDAAQVAHLAALLDAAERGRFLFVVNWTSHDYPDLLARLPREARKLAKIWAYTGLKTGDGADKPALALWDAALQRGAAR